MKMPKISVIMCVYNGEKYLKEAIDSILCQTYTNFEFIIVDDGSTDNTNKIIKSYNDERIILITNEKNMDKIYSRNIALEKAKGDYVAVFDSDDISFPERFEEQIKFLEATPEIGACGAQAHFIGLPVKKSYRWCPTDPEETKCMLLFEPPIAHPSAMVRKSILDKFNIKYRNFLASQDYAFWVDIAEHTKLSNLDKYLIYYRRHSGQVSTAKAKLQIECDLAIKKDFYEKIGLKISEQDYETLKIFCTNNVPDNMQLLKEYESLLLKIKEYNEETNYFDKDVLNRVLFQKWYTGCLKSSRNGLWNLGTFYTSQLAKSQNLSFKDTIMFFVNLIVGKLQLYPLYKNFIKRSLKKKTKIAIIQPSIGNVFAGAEMVAIELAKELRNYCDVTVFCEKKIDKISDICVEIQILHRDKVKKTKSPFIKGLNFILKKFTDNSEIAIEYLSGLFPIFLHLLFKNYDVLYPHNNWGGLLICDIIRKIKGTPIIYTEHGSHYPKCFKRNLSFKPNKYIVLNKEFETWVKKNHSEIDIEYIPNGVDITRFNTSISPALINIPRPVILAVGRNDEIKRLDLAINAVSKIKDASLVIVSTGQNLDELEQKGNELLGKSRFKLFRNISPDHIPTYYAACDVFTLPSEGEACSLVYIEAMACNKPCVAPNDAARSEIIGDAGILCDVTNTNEYVEALKQALSKDWGNIPYEKAKKLDWKEIANRYKKIIEDISNFKN